MEGQIYQTFLSIFLLPSNEFFCFIFALFLLGTQRQKMAIGALQVALFIMVFNSFLKGIWQVPLPDTLNSSGWAFPSGHMHFATGFWIFLALSSRKSYALSIVFFMLASLAFSLHASGFHHISDLPLAFLLGAFEALIIHYALTHSDKPFYVSLCLFLASCVFMYLNPKSYPFLYQGLGALAALPVIYFITQFYDYPQRNTLDLSLCVVVLIFAISQILGLGQLELSSTLYALVCFMLTLISLLVPLLSKRATTINE
jgi:hypothetical protein|tara:strand:- start:1911 stop:2681 length:771 start_codon:yes stop_codon:yes gene_type:complete